MASQTHQSETHQSETQSEKGTIIALAVAWVVVILATSGALG